MDIHISKESEVPIHEQVAAQVVFLIATGGVKSGANLPSVRALAQRLGVHRNTIAQAYRDLILNLLVEKRAGRRLTIRAREPEPLQRGTDLDELINVTILEARRRGYSLQQLHERLRGRLLAGPPDHLLVLSDDSGMRTLLPKELEQRFKCRVAVSTPGELLSDPAKMIGALVVSAPGHIPKIQALLSAERPAVAITYSPADEYVEAIRRLQKPSLIAVVSISQYFLEMSLRLFAAAVGRRHSMQGYLMAGSRPEMSSAADLVFCDSITYPVVRPRYKGGAVFLYRLISPICLDQISSILTAESDPL
jgi:DNA-binding transcriptional regulator YhcF (GntR family)